MSDKKPKPRPKSTDIKKKATPKPAAKPKVIEKIDLPEKQPEQLIQKPIPTGMACCENCKDMAITYCVQCDILLCGKCFQQIHQNIALQQHQQVNTSITQLFTRQCAFHQKRCRFVCLTCGVFICDVCRGQLHAGAQHNVMPIQDAFYYRLSVLNQILSAKVAPKQQELQTALLKFQNTESKLDEVKSVIEARIRQYSDKLIQNLERQKQQKMAVFQSDRARLQQLNQQIEYIQRSLIEAQSLSFNQMAQSQVQLQNPSFIQKQPDNVFQFLNELEAQIKSLQIVNYESYCEVLNDFDPMLVDELSIKQNQVENANQLNLKEQQIQALSAQLQQTQQNYQQELEKWMKLTENYAVVVKNHSLECVFCGCKMAKASANSRCDQNDVVDEKSFAQVRKAEKVVERDGEVSVEQAVSMVGNGRHYWVQGV